MKHRYFYNPILLKSGNKYQVGIYKKDKHGSHIVTNVMFNTHSDTLKSAQELVSVLNSRGADGRTLRRMFK